jgi:anti-anti-sigma factor
MKGLDGAEFAGTECGSDRAGLSGDEVGTMDDGVLRVEVSHLNGTTHLAVIGELDANSTLALQAPLYELSLERHILVDMAGVGFIDSSGLKVLLAQRMRMVESDGSIYICNPSEAVRRLIETTGLTDVLLETRTLVDD